MLSNVQQFSFLKEHPMLCSFSFQMVTRLSTVSREKGLTDWVTMKSISSGYLIQCNDEPRNLFNDCESGFKGFTFT